MLQEVKKNYDYISLISDDEETTDEHADRIGEVISPIVKINNGPHNENINNESINKNKFTKYNNNNNHNKKIINNVVMEQNLNELLEFDKQITIRNNQQYNILHYNSLEKYTNTIKNNKNNSEKNSKKKTNGTKLNDEKCKSKLKILNDVINDKNYSDTDANCAKKNNQNLIFTKINKPKQFAKKSRNNNISTNVGTNINIIQTKKINSNINLKTINGKYSNTSSNNKKMIIPSRQVVRDIINTKTITKIYNKQTQIIGTAVNHTKDKCTATINEPIKIVNETILHNNQVNNIIKTNINKPTVLNSNIDKEDYEQLATKISTKQIKSSVLIPKSSENVTMNKLAYKNCFNYKALQMHEVRKKSPYASEKYHLKHCNNINSGFINGVQSANIINTSLKLSDTNIRSVSDENTINKQLKDKLFEQVSDDNVKSNVMMCDKQQYILHIDSNINEFNISTGSLLDKSKPKRKKYTSRIKKKKKIEKVPKKKATSLLNIIDKKQLNKIHVKLYQCSTCKKNFKTKHYFKIHSDNCVLLVCSKCDKVFTSLKIYETHIGLCGMPVPDCKLCGMKMLNYRMYYNHKRVHVKKTHTCSICKKIFKRKDSLKLHIREIHDHIMYSCKICNKTNMSRGKYYIHMNSCHSK